MSMLTAQVVEVTVAQRTVDVTAVHRTVEVRLRRCAAAEEPSEGEELFEAQLLLLQESL